MVASPPFKIAVTGVESTGKTTLASSLAQALGGAFVPECARFDAQVMAGKADLSTLSRLGHAQYEACREAERCATSEGLTCIVSDSDATVLQLWGEHVFNQVPKGLGPLEDWPDLVLLCTPNIPWEADPLRSMPSLEDRLALHQRYEVAIAHHPKTAVIDAQGQEKRLDQAVRAFHKFFG